MKTVYDPILRVPVTAVTVFDEQLKKLSVKMLSAMHRKIGMGLAANQFGVNKDLFVLELRTSGGESKLKRIPPLVLCNAKIVKVSKEKDVMAEGCLSLPGLELPVIRSNGVTVEAQDLNGKPVTIKARGLLARILQHEIDHLNGILFADRAEGVKDLKNYTWAKLVFFGSDEFSLTVLERLQEAGLNVTAVICETDKPTGRGGQLTPLMIKTQALKNNIAVFQPQTKSEITTILSQLKPDLVVLASYGKILPTEALEIPIYGALNLHPSLLPKYRGATPIQSTILANDKETGATLMKMNAGIDTGEIIAQTKTELDGSETFVSLRSRLAVVSSQLLLKTLPLYLSGQVKLRAQGEEATQTTKLTKDMGEISWDDSAEMIDRQIRALNPRPGVFTFIGDKRLKILTSAVDDNKLYLKTVLLEGRNPTTWANFVRGHEGQLKKTDWYGKIA